MYMYEDRHGTARNYKDIVSTLFFATLGLHLGFSAKQRIWQVSACKMEPQGGTIITLEPATQPAVYLL